MALFAVWQDVAAEPGVPAAALHARLRAAAHIVSERTIEAVTGDWRVVAFACASGFYTAAQQVWRDDAGGVCLIHGVIWRFEGGEAHMLDAGGVASLLDRPGLRLPEDVGGEYAVVRIYGDGMLEAFGDPAGLHQIFRRDDGAPVVANRAAFVATLAGAPRPDRHSALWLGAIGYRVGSATGWAGVRQMRQGDLLSADASGVRILARPGDLPSSRGFDHGGAALVEAGLQQAMAAIRLAAGDGPLDLPITGGKDSRVILAIALAAGLRDRLTLFTRGYAGHPDVVVGARIAARIGVPHRREAPLGSDLPADLAADAFMALLATIAWQGDGGMGGWDNVTRHAIGRGTLVSGHLGEVLKAYAKRMPDGALDPAAMVRLQAPFDPMDLLRPAARAGLVAELADQMAQARAAGAQEDDLPDLFYWRNRVPNWLGGIRGIKAFERQPILPLGVPALMRLAFVMTAAERQAERAHFELIERAAPELIDLPFAHQSWHPSLGAPVMAPVLAAAGSNLFGSWQWSVNRVPAVRAALARLFASIEIPLWEAVDRPRLIAALHDRRFDMFDAISLLGFAVAAIHQAGLGRTAKLGGVEEAGALAAAAETPHIVGHLDAMTREGGVARLNGWAYAPDWPGAAVAVEARLDGTTVAAVAADQPRPDLAAAGIGDGRHAFTIALDAHLLDDAARLTVAGAGSEQPLEGGVIALTT